MHVPGAIIHAETVPRPDQRFKPDRDVDPLVKGCLVPRSLSSPRPGGVLSSSPGVAAGPRENDILQPACRLSGEPWSPNQLRHSCATRLRAEFDLEAAQAVLGHSTPNMTLTYAERDLAKVMRIMAEVG